MFCVLRPGRPKHFSKMSSGFLGQSRFLYKKKKKKKPLGSIGYWDVGSHVLMSGNKDGCPRQSRSLRRYLNIQFSLPCD